MSSKTVKAGRWFRTKVEDVVGDDIALEVAEAITDADIPGEVAEAITDADIPGEVAEAVGALTPEDIFGAPATHLANVSVTGTYADDDEAIEAAINGILAILVSKGLMASGE